MLMLKDEYNKSCRTRVFIEVNLEPDRYNKRYIVKSIHDDCCYYRKYCSTNWKLIALLNYKKITHLLSQCKWEK